MFLGDIKTAKWICFFFKWISLFSAPLSLPHIHEKAAQIDDRNDAPFISHMTFMRICDFIIDRNTPFFDPDWVDLGDIVYVDPDYVRWFEEKVHDQIKKPYILVARIDDWLSGNRMKKLLHDPKLTAWFCWNLLFSFHPKLFPIPMGQGVFAWTHEGPEQLFRRIENPPFKQHLLYMNHCPRSFGERDKLVKIFENKPYCFSRNYSNQPFKMIPKNEYLDDLSASYFVLSPIGYGIECWRTWEAIVLGCIPILLHSFQDSLFEELPVLLLHNWEEINEKLLFDKYAELIQLKTEKAYFYYWEKLILDTKAKIIADPLSFSPIEKTLFSASDLSDLRSILGEHQSLFYKGCLTTIRSQQLLYEHPSLSEIYLQDLWFEPSLFDASIIKRIHPFVSEAEFEEKITLQGGGPIFLDLTYFRSSLLKDERYWQHSLKSDIEDLYLKTPIGTLICGNMTKNRYVNEVLAQIGRENKICVKSRGDFWFLVRDR